MTTVHSYTATQKTVDRFFKLVSWYDNEWGYFNRCVDLLKYILLLSIWRSYQFVFWKCECPIIRLDTDRSKLV